MTEKFPELINEQIALSRADINTGIILDEEFNYATSINQKVYTILENITDAISLARKIILIKNDIECYLHSSENQVVAIITIENLNSF